MPRTRSLAWSELKIGMLTVFALVMAAMMVFAVGGAGGFFWQRYSLKTRFPNIATVKSGTPVRLSGVEVGTVTDVQLSGSGAEVWLEVSNDVRPLITNRSLAVIGAISLLGEGAIDITAAPEGTPIPEWGYIPSGVAPGSIAALSDAANQGLTETTKLIADLRAGKGTLGKLVTDDAVYAEAQALIQAAERVTSAVDRGRGSLGKFVNDPVVYRELAASTANLNEITGRIKAGEGSLGALLNDPALAKSLTSASANMEAVTGRLAKGEGTAGKLLTDDALFNRLDAMTGKLDALAGRLNQGQGTAGRLLQDEALYENMNTAVAELRGLLSDIRKDPKKYLNVKVSLF